MVAGSRNLEKVVFSDVEKKFVFLSGSRQVEKTTLAKKIISQKKDGSFMKSGTKIQNP